MKYYCNPMKIEYKYQFQKYLGKEGGFSIFREAADPSLVKFKDSYYLFPSMCGGFYTSKDLIEWKFHGYQNKMPIYDYAPDVRVIGDYLYFCASKDNENSSFFRTKDPLEEPFEEIKGSFAFWDPNLFWDNGHLYFYWGCTNTDPIYGVELDIETLRPKTKPIPMIDSDIQNRGYERNGENHHMPEISAEEKEKQIDRTVRMLMEFPEDQRRIMGYGNEQETREKLEKIMSNRPFIEGAWMTKYNQKYYLQYAITGTEYNVYNDGVYISDHPLGPFVPAANNPYSYKPEGFIKGAGHGSTLIDSDGRVWHTSTMGIIDNYRFERRIGLWKAGFDEDGELYCDQNYGDWPINRETKPFSKPDYMLLSYKKQVTASSGSGKEYVTDEEIRTHWKADAGDENAWVQVDLGKICCVNAVSVNFADDGIVAEKPEVEPMRSSYEIRYMENRKMKTQWRLEASRDGVQYDVLEDKRNADTDYSHDLVVKEEGAEARYIRLVIYNLPYGQIPCVSGLRIFGRTNGELPEQIKSFDAEYETDMDVKVAWNLQNPNNVTGCNILWGHKKDKLYHSCCLYGKNEWTIGAIVKNQKLYVRIDTFNESGITEGIVREVSR